MGRLTREKDWAKTSLGAASNWPQSLRTALSIVLNSKFPMYLFWGDDLLSFYNDAYRPSLGIDGKHPSILGMRGEDAWAEVWPTIKPWIDQVLVTGEGIWNEDHLVPIYRNGIIENVYWTFSYSPIMNEADKAAGVFVTCVETTGKVAALKRSEESRWELEYAIDATELGIWDFNPETYKFSANNRLKKWFGLAEEEQIELKDAISAIKQSDRQRVTHAIARALEFSSGGNYDIQYTIINSVTKAEIIVHAKGKAWFSKDQKPYRFNGTLEDTTKEAAILKQIRESEERYHHLIYSSPSAIGILYGEDMIITIGNDAILEIWGKGREIIGKSYFEALPELAEQGYKEVFTQVYKTGIPFNAVETPLEIWQKGIKTLKYYNLLLYAQRNINGDIDGIGIIATEVTSQALLNKQIAENAEKFRLLADSMPQQVWTSDPEGNLNYYNQSVFDYSGLTPEQINKDGWLQIVHPDDRDKNIEQWGHAIKTGNNFLLQHRFRRYDGQYRWQLSRAVPQKDEKGTIQLWVGTSTDIQEQKTFTDELGLQVKERTKELSASNEELEKMNKELQSFAYISSHDLQEPLRKIQTFTSQLMEKEIENLTDNGKHIFLRIQDSALRMQTLINDLLAYSRTSNNDGKFELTDLNKVVEDIRADLKEELQQKNACIEASGLKKVNIIPFQFNQLLHNLIGNSLKFSSPGRPPVITIKGTSINGKDLRRESFLDTISYYHINITDNGLGFAPEYGEKIFELFQRLHGNDKYKGTGIGLAIVKKIVENHHGVITATGELDKGASFDIYLPL